MKTLPDAANKPQYLQEVFKRIAPHYDLMNRLMTGGADLRWKKQVVRLMQCEQGQVVLDLGCGTGDLGRMIQREEPGLQLVAADFSFTMMVTGRISKGNLPFVNADAMCIPFMESSFDRVVSGYLLRNVANLETTLQEIFRVMKNGGIYIVLDTTQPKKNFLSPLIYFYMHRVIPFVGGLISGDRDAYEYLPESSEQFLSAETLAEKMRSAGFSGVTFRRYMFGTVAIHIGHKE